MEAQIEQVAANIFQIPIPVPFPMKYVYSYVLKDGDEFIVIDAGLNYRAAREAWLEVFNELAIEPSQISTIYVTHFHPDHFGLSGWLQEQTGAKVIMSEVEYKMAQKVWFEENTQANAIAAMMLHHGVPNELSLGMVDNMNTLRKNVLPLPEVTSLTANELTFGNRKWEIIEASGHCDAQVCFYDREERIMIVADQVLNKITPNISLWPNASDNPLFKYFNSLSMLKGYEVDRALPGHGSIIENFAVRIDEILEHHQKRLQRMKNALEGNTTAYEVACRVFNHEAFTSHQWRFAMAETLAHLEYLVHKREISKQLIDNKTVYFSAN